MQCQANKRNGDPCKRPALKNSNFCQFHGGRSWSRGALKALYRLPTVYSKYLNGTLQDTFEELLSADTTEQVSVYEELALIKMTACDVVQRYSALHMLPDTDERKMNLILAAGAMMREVLTEVVKTCESAARVEHMSKDNVSVLNIAYITHQITRVAYKVMGDSAEGVEKAKEFERLIRETIRVHKDAVEGTSMTPQQVTYEAELMDNSVPGSPQDEMKPIGDFDAVHGLQYPPGSDSPVG